MLEGAPASGRAAIKAAEIAKTGPIARTKRGSYDIEIVSIGATDRGVEVFARAWDENGQIGFGRDGTVDIERFNIINPPILVADPEGMIVRSGDPSYFRSLYRTPLSGGSARSTFAISGTDHKSETTKVQTPRISSREEWGAPPRRFTQRGGAASPVDGYVAIDNTAPNSVSWPTIRDAADGNLTGVSVTSGAIVIRSQNGTTNWSDIFRGTAGFDTSSLGGDTIDAATMSWYTTSGDIYDTNTALGGWIKEVALVSSSPASDANLVNGDYDGFGTTPLAANRSITSWNTSAYNDFTLEFTRQSAYRRLGSHALWPQTRERQSR